MDSIGTLLQQHTFYEKTDWQKRQEALDAIYHIYTSAQERKHRNRSNRMRYIIWAKAQRFSKEEITTRRDLWEKFLKSPKCLKEHPAKVLAIRLSHLKTSRDMYYILSVVKDLHNRDKAVTPFIFGATKPEVTPQQ